MCNKMDSYLEFLELSKSFIESQTTYGSSCRFTAMAGNTCRLKDLGDFSFQLIPSDSGNDTDLNSKITADIRQLIDKSKSWPLLIHRINESRRHISLYLDRTDTFRRCCGYILHHTKDHSNQVSQQLSGLITLCDSTNDNNYLTSYRCKLIFNAVKKLLEYGENNGLILEPKDEFSKILISTKSNLPGKKREEIDHVVVVGTVTANSDVGQSITSEDYVNKRSVDMQLIAQHKYGLRIKDAVKFNDLIRSLGRSAAIIDMVELRHNNCMKLQLEQPHVSNSKGAAFILYNCARLETLLRTFKSRCDSKYYGVLPDLNNVDFSLLKEEEEWELFFVFVLQFQSMVKNVIGDIGSGIIRIHLLCKFITNLSNLFSGYYRRVRILTENREHLLPTLYARIYLLRCIQMIYQQVFQFLDLELVQRM